MSDLSDKDLDISKMKVADLKKELKNRGLSTEGKKGDLIDRLQTAIGDSALLDDTVGDHDDLLDEEILSDEDPEELTKIEEEAEKEKAEEKTVEGRKRKNAGSIEAERPGKKIILKRSTLSVSEELKGAAKNGDKETKEEKENEGENEKSESVLKVGGLSAQERLERRAAKFGVPMSLEAKKEARAARFGLPSADSKVGGLVSTNIDVLKKRAERFGTKTVGSMLDKVELEERRKKRAERFGNVEPATSAKPKVTAPSSTAEEKKRLRAQRFQAAS